MHIFSTGWFIGTAEVQSFIFEGVSPCCLQWLSRWSLKTPNLKNRLYSLFTSEEMPKSRWLFDDSLSSRFFDTTELRPLLRNEGLEFWDIEVKFYSTEIKVRWREFRSNEDAWRAGQQKPMADQNAMHSPAFLAQPSFLCNKALPQSDTKRTLILLAFSDNFWRHLVRNRK